MGQFTTIRAAMAFAACTDGMRDNAEVNRVGYGDWTPELAIATYWAGEGCDLGNPELTASEASEVDMALTVWLAEQAA